MQYKHFDSFTGLCCICSNPVGPLPDIKQDMIGFVDSLRNYFMKRNGEFH